MAFVLVRESDKGRLFLWTPRPGHVAAPAGPTASDRFEPVEGERVDAAQSAHPHVAHAEVRVSPVADGWHVEGTDDAIHVGRGGLVLADLGSSGGARPGAAAADGNGHGNGHGHGRGNGAAPGARDLITVDE